MDEVDLIIIGGGLSGCEAAWQAAKRGVRVRLYEMRPHKRTGAHISEKLAELVCSNSFGSDLPDRASGLLKNELRRMQSLLLNIAEETSVPAGGALAVDRDLFATRVTETLQANPCIKIVREEVIEIPEKPTIIASGPMTSEHLSKAIAKLGGEEHLYFFDAIAPIISRESINMETAFVASRYQRGEQAGGDYINCPMNKSEYEAFVHELIHANRIPLKDFEDQIRSGVRAGSQNYFEGCLPVEIIAERGKDSLAFGPMRPVGLIDPKTGKRPYAVVQLRQDNLSASLFNLVGFQTNLTYAEQKRVFSKIPGLEKADFIRYGQMHRNTFIFSPKLLRPTLQFRDRDDLFFSGQITGIEGYIGNIASGLLAGQNAARWIKQESLMIMPVDTMIGALCQYITHADAADFQPMKANFGLMPPLMDGKRYNKRQRAAAHAERAIRSLEEYLSYHVQ